MTIIIENISWRAKLFSMHTRNCQLVSFTLITTLNEDHTPSNETMLARHDTENNVWKARLLRQSWELSDAGSWSGGVQILWRWSWVTRWEALIVSCFQAFRPTIPEMLPCVWPPSLPRCISYAGWLARFHSNHLIKGKVAVAYWSESQTSGWHCLILVAEKPLLSVMTSQWCGSTSTWSGRAGANFAPHHQAVPIAQPWQQLLLLLKTGMCVIDSN